MSESEATARSISLDQFAAMSAAIDAGVPTDQVLAEAELSPQAWEATKERWLAEIAGQAVLGRFAPGRRCAEIASAERPRARAKAKKARKKAAGAQPVVPVAVMASIVDVRDNPAVAAMKERDRSAAPLPIAVAPPAAPAPPPPPAVNEKVKGPPPRAAHKAMTAAMPVFTVDTPALPFQLTGDAAPAKDKTRRPPDKALPFVQPGSPPKPQRETVAISIVGFEDPLDEGGTRPMEPSPLRPALPFAPSSAPAEPERAPVSHRDDGALPFHSPSPPAAAPAASPDAAAEAMQRARTMSLHDYANLCAGVRAFPDGVAWVQSIFGLDAASWGALHAAWRSRFDQDARLKAQWAELVAQGVPYWKQRRPG